MGDASDPFLGICVDGFAARAGVVEDGENFKSIGLVRGESTTPIVLEAAILLSATSVRGAFLGTPFTILLALTVVCPNLDVGDIAFGLAESVSSMEFTFFRLAREKGVLSVPGALASLTADPKRFDLLAVAP